MYPLTHLAGSREVCQESRPESETLAAAVLSGSSGLGACGAAESFAAVFARKRTSASKHGNPIVPVLAFKVDAGDGLAPFDL